MLLPSKWLMLLMSLTVTFPLPPGTTMCISTLPYLSSLRMKLVQSTSEPLPGWAVSCGAVTACTHMHMHTHKHLRLKMRTGPEQEYWCEVRML